MKKIVLTASILAAFISCKQAEDKARPDTPLQPVNTAETTTTAPDSATIQKAWIEYMTPGEIHKQLALDNGKWNESITIWESPGAKPTTNKMTAESRMILGGRYQQMTHKGNFMGMDYEGIGTIGYDNASKKMVSTWVDNMGTGMMYMAADYDGKSPTMEFKGEVTDPVTKKAKPSREIFTIVDDNTRQIEMFDVAPNGTEFKNMEITMTRAK